MPAAIQREDNEKQMHSNGKKGEDYRRNYESTMIGMSRDREGNRRRSRCVVDAAC